jgi:hypothetical protein
MQPVWALNIPTQEPGPGGVQAGQAGSRRARRGQEGPGGARRGQAGLTFGLLAPEETGHPRHLHLHSSPVRPQ